MKDHELDQEIKKIMASLENHYPDDIAGPDQIWNVLVSKRKNTRVRRIAISWTIAASFIVVILSVFIPQHRRPEKNNSSASVNTIDTININAVSVEQKDAAALVRRLCEKKNIVCTSPEFKELEEELNASASLLTEIKKQLSIFGHNDQLIRSKSRIEQHQSAIIKAMVEKI